MNANKTKTVLVVDDDADYLLQQQTHLQAEGYKVLTAETSDEAIDVLERETVDLAVVDLMMEHMDEGFVLCRQIKQMSPDMPVIMVTAVADKTGMQFDATSGDAASWIKADRMLAKPVRPEQLKQEISRLLGR